MEAFAYRQFLDLERVHWWFRGRRAIFEALVAERIRPLAGGPGFRCLDLGCGVGGNLEMLANEGLAFGIDFDSGALQISRDRGFTRLARADGARLPFAAGAFNAVTALDALEHIDDDQGAVRECARVLSPGGFLLISGPAYQFLTTHQDEVVHHRRRYTIGALKKLLTNAGLVLEHASYINFILFPPILLAILAIKLKQRLVPPGPDDQKSNASIPCPGPLNALLTAVFSFERRLVTRTRLPFGHSLVALGRKPG
jgi:SAM-dependent methyltransferase